MFLLKTARELTTYIEMDTKYINGNQVTVEIPVASRGAFTIAIGEAGWRYADQNGVLHILK